MFAIDYRLPAAYDYSYPNISINMQYSLGSPVTLVRLALFCSLPLGHPSQGRGTHGKNAPRAPRAPFDTDTHLPNCKPTNPKFTASTSTQNVLSSNSSQSDQTED